MGKIGEAYVVVSAKTKDFDEGLDKSQSKLTEWVGHARKLVAAFIIAKVGHEFLGFMMSAVKASSDLTESANKAQVAFGAAFSQISAFADDSAKRFGSVKSEIFDLTAGLGFMFTNVGLTKDKAAELAVQLATIAGDVQSIQNMPAADVLLKIKAGLAGEAEPLRSLGVNVQEQNVERKARSMGFEPDENAHVSSHSTAVAKLTDQQKLLARIALITEGLKYAQGDLASTIGEYANQTRKAAGDWENMKVEIGEHLKPVMLELIKTAYEAGDAFKTAFGRAPLDTFRDAMNQNVENLKSFKQIATIVSTEPWSLDRDIKVAKIIRRTAEGRSDPIGDFDAMSDLEKKRFAKEHPPVRSFAEQDRLDKIEKQRKVAQDALDTEKSKADAERRNFMRFERRGFQDTFELRWSQTHKPQGLSPAADLKWNETHLASTNRNSKMDTADFKDWFQEAVFKKAEDDKQDLIAKNTAHANDILEKIQKNGAEMLKLHFGAILF